MTFEPSKVTRLWIKGREDLINGRTAFETLVRVGNWERANQQTLHKQAVTYIPAAFSSLSLFGGLQASFLNLG